MQNELLLMSLTGSWLVWQTAAYIVPEVALQASVQGLAFTGKHGLAQSLLLSSLVSWHPGVPLGAEEGKFL